MAGAKDFLPGLMGGKAYNGYFYLIEEHVIPYLYLNEGASLEGGAFYFDTPRMARVNTRADYAPWAAGVTAPGGRCGH